MILCKKVEYYYLIDLKNSDLSTLIHNDLYFSNILLTDEEKVYFVDWEYASMGNKYFDLALFCLCYWFKCWKWNRTSFTIQRC